LPPPWQGGALPDELHPHIKMLVVLSERHIQISIMTKNDFSISLFHGKTTAIGICYGRIAKNRLLIPCGNGIGASGRNRFSAEKPRRLQHTTGILPRAAFRFLTEMEIELVPPGGIAFLRKSHGGCNMPQAYC
ncbi:MAG: hypothetical protein ACLUDG_04870, partial [Butyricicoccus sp.]